MGDEEAMAFSVRAVVRDGRVVLDAPLDAPDGTVVTIRPAERERIRTIGADPTPLTEEQVRWLEEDLAWLRARAARQAAEKKSRPKAA